MKIINRANFYFFRFCFLFFWFFFLCPFLCLIFFVFYFLFSVPRGPQVRGALNHLHLSPRGYRITELYLTTILLPRPYDHMLEWSSSNLSAFRGIYNSISEFRISLKKVTSIGLQNLVIWLNWTSFLRTICRQWHF